MTSTMVSLPTFLAIAGLVLAAVEIAIFGLGTIFLIFISIGLLLTSGLMFVGVLPETFLVAAASVGVCSLLSMAVLWKPLRALQSNQQSHDDQPNVFSGLTFNLEQELTKGATVKHKYSGVEWKLVLEGDQEVLPAGTEVEVIKSSVGKMHVKPTS